MKKIILLVLSVLTVGRATASSAPFLSEQRFSTAGFYTLSNSGRDVYDMNPSWLLHVGSAGQEAFSVNYDDANWIAVNLPNGIEVLPENASGGKNYRGAVWYRKHFDAPSNIAEQRKVLYFEAIMGKSKIWVNGELVKEHFGGFTPIIIDVTDILKAGEKNLIAVMADNSDDPIYPPGKPQDILDFCYFGGIYRDCYLITTDRNDFITDANEVNKVAGGGVVVEFKNVSKQSAEVVVTTDHTGSSKVNYTLIDPNGNVAYKGNKNEIKLKNPLLWSPEHPNLYKLEVRLVGKGGVVVDGYMLKIGIRSFEFSYRDGFILNGEKYPRKLIGANRHQDFAVIGNALSNSLHYRDAAKLKASGMEIIRNAHYPQDPAFMDACDELGLFVIVNTPGWQFWNENPIFEQRVYSDIRNIARRDRNHASVLMWEPILNETRYPENFASNVHKIIKEEVPFKGANYTGADLEARGAKYFDINFKHPESKENLEYDSRGIIDTTKVYFTREWGDNVDDWNSHNSPSRVARSWGEQPQLVQAIHYAKPPYGATSYNMLQNAPNYHVGGTLWHSFDHQRGYHPDPFYGGIMDSFRRPKTSYYMFQSQAIHIDPMVYIANELTPFSNEDVVVFSNCDAVRLRTFTGDTIRLKKRADRWFVFENAWNFMTDKALSRDGEQKQAYILAEGLNVNGDVVANEKKSMSRRPTALNLDLDTMGVTAVANGGDLVVITAKMVDKNGVVKRLNGEHIQFRIEGEGRIVGSSETFNNPVAVQWGEASVLVQTTTNAGKIKVTAEVVGGGANSPVGGQIEFSTIAPTNEMIYDKALQERIRTDVTIKKEIEIDPKVINNRLKEVEKQQSEFGEK